MNQNKRTLRGLTLMEALLFLGLAAVVIVGAFALYNNASSSANMNQARTELQTYIGGVRSLYATSNDFSTANTELVISANIAPSAAVGTDSGGDPALINPWGGLTIIAGQTRSFTVEFEDIPDEACTAMLSSGLIDAGTITSMAANGGTSYTAAITPAVAISECSAGDNAVIFTAR